MKKIVIYLGQVQTIILFLFSIMLVGTALALLESRDVKVNHFTLGYNSSDIVEVWDSPPAINANESTEKKISIRNTGNVPCFARVFAELSDADIRDRLEIEKLGDQWTKYEDGYWYCSSIIQPDELSQNLTFQLRGKELIDENFEFLVYAETVDAGDFTKPKDAFVEIAP